MYVRILGGLPVPLQPANFLVNQSIADPAYFQFVKTLADARLIVPTSLETVQYLSYCQLMA